MIGDNHLSGLAFSLILTRVSNRIFLLSLVDNRLFRKSIFGAADEIELKFMNRFFTYTYSFCLGIIHNIYVFLIFSLLLGETMRM